MVNTIFEDTAIIPSPEPIMVIKSKIDKTNTTSIAMGIPNTIIAPAPTQLPRVVLILSLNLLKNPGITSKSIMPSTNRLKKEITFPPIYEAVKTAHGALAAIL